MTEKEAMEIIMQVAYDGEFPNNSNEAFGIACKCIEKQIPKKPSIKKWSGGDKTYNCPSCDCDYNRFYISKEYCMYCGQKIDWEGVEE